MKAVSVYHLRLVLSIQTKPFYLVNFLYEDFLKTQQIIKMSGAKHG